MHDDQTVHHWQQTLNRIDRMLAEISELHVTISSQPLNLAGPTVATEPPLPGGDMLDVTGPWSSDATYATDPTPRQVITEWAITIWDAHDQTPPNPLRYTHALTYVREKIPWILESPWADEWCDDINAVHGRLRALCPPEVDETHDSRDTPATIDLPSMANLIPDGRTLTRDEAEHFWPGALDNKQWAALRKRAQRVREAGHDLRHGYYPVEWIRDTLTRQACA